MKKNLIMFFLVFFVSSFLTGCVTPALSDYQIWKNSADAEDLNGDRKINELDYQLFLEPPLSAYEVWKDSDDALDLNNDRRIDEADYELFLNPPPSDFEVWSESTDATDLNGDTVINETDYELFLNPPPSAYEVWRDSNDALDLNDDRRIDEADYELFLNPPPSAYEIWSQSTDAEDLNDDTLINEADYELYVDFSQYVGNYHIVNYSYIGSAASLFGGEIKLSNLGQYLAQMQFVVEINKKVNIIIPESIIILFGTNYSVILESIENMLLTKLSDNLLALDTHVYFEGTEFNFTLYFDKIENGFSINYTTYFIGLDQIAGTITFNVIKD